jgi:hypothetical protein
MRLHILVDANVLAAHYSKKTTSSTALSNNANKLLAGRALHIEPSFLVPNFCIAEVFAVFEKYRWGASWNPQVKKSNALTPSEFVAARAAFHSDIHNASAIMQYDLNRYHILCADLIAPVNAAYQIHRNRKNKASAHNSKRVRVASTFDLLFVSMGIWLQKHYGADSFLMVSGDTRIQQIVMRARAAGLSKNIKAHLTATASQVGIKYGPEIYPKVLNLAQASKRELEFQFPGWSPAW